MLGINAIKKLYNDIYENFKNIILNLNPLKF